MHGLQGPTAPVHRGQLHHRVAATTSFSDDDSFLDSHILDSTGFLELSPSSRRPTASPSRTTRWCRRTSTAWTASQAYLARKRRRERGGGLEPDRGARTTRPHVLAARLRGRGRAHLRVDGRAVVEHRSIDAAWSSPCRAASTARSARRSPCARSAPSKVLRPDAARARSRARQRPSAGRSSPSTSGIALRGPRHRAGARGDRLLPPARRGDPRVSSPSTATAGRARSSSRGGLDGGDQLLQARRAVARRADCRRRACRCASTCRSSPRPTSSSASARRSSTSTPTA